MTQRGSPRPSSTIQRSPGAEVFGSSSVLQVAVFDAVDHEFEELIGEGGIVAERERAEVLVPFGDRLWHGTA